jgi:hypothetical protein
MEAPFMLRRVSIHRIPAVQAAAFSALMAAVSVSLAGSASALTEQPQRLQSGTRPAVTVVRQTFPAGCGEWGSMVWEACQAMPSCSADRIGRAEIARLDDALNGAVRRHLQTACDGQSCGGARSRNDTNSFACRGASQVCMTRRIEFSCARPAAIAQAGGASARRTPAGRTTARPSVPDDPPPPRRVPPPPAQRDPGSAPRRVPAPAPLPIEPSAPQRVPSAPHAIPAHISAATYRLQALANDMAGNERYFTRDHKATTTQKFGYDISMRRLKDDGAWTSLIDGVTDHWDDPKNVSYVIYNKPFYAMRDGTIMGCWRNAPDNPRPKLPTEDADKIALADKKWLHQSFRNGLIPGGGNSLWIKHDDGTYALYAHAAPGTIPASLCPNSKALMDAPTPDDAELLDGVVGPATQVPAGLRKRVKAGDFLGRAGNTGNSTGPHTHIHVQKLNASGKWEGTPIVFERGLSTPWSDGKATLEGWTSFSGKIIPKGEVLFWPPTRLGKEYARHGLPAEDLQRTFSHLANSGFAPEVLDCSSVGGNVYYNMVWRPANGAWRAHFGMTGDTIEAKFDAAKTEGLHPVYIDSCSSKNGPRYAAIFEKTGGLYRWRFNIDADDHQSVFENASGEGLRPVNVSVISMNGQRRYTSLFRKVDYGSMILKSQLDEAGYQQAVNENKEAGRKPVYVAVYMHGGKPNFSAIFAQKPAGDWRARHDLSGSDYQDEWSGALKGGFLTRALSGYDGAAASLELAAVWRR